MEISSKGYEILHQFEKSEIYRVVKYNFRPSGRWWELKRKVRKAFQREGSMLEVS